MKLTDFQNNDWLEFKVLEKSSIIGRIRISDFYFRGFAYILGPKYWWHPFSVSGWETWWPKAPEYLKLQHNFYCIAESDIEKKL